MKKLPILMMCLALIYSVTVPDCAASLERAQVRKVVRSLKKHGVKAITASKFEANAPRRGFAGKEIRSASAQTTWGDIFDFLKTYAALPIVVPQRVSYTTRDAWGKPVTVTGAMLIPYDVWHGFKPRSMPILAFQHPTQVQRKYSPSKCTSLSKMWEDPQKNVALGMAMALAGYIVVLPDYPGMGENYDVHPYCHMSLAHSVVDLVRMARDHVGDSKRRRILPWMAKWNKKLYLMGYSEGGYVTMAAAKEFQEKHADEFTVSAAAPLDGPYSLSGAMKNLMLAAGPEYDSPYFMPYVVNGYDAVYASRDSSFSYDGNVISSVPGYSGDFSSRLRELMAGANTGEEITAFMRLAEPYEGPRSILTPGFINELQREESSVNAILKENDAFRGWTPKMPIMMFHNHYDDLVPFENAEEARQAFLAAGATNVGLIPFSARIGSGTIHESAAPVAYLLGFAWITFSARQAG